MTLETKEHTSMAVTIIPIKQIDGRWRADDADDEAPLCTIEFHNELALLPDEKKRELVMALVRRYCAEDM